MKDTAAMLKIQKAADNNDSDSEDELNGWDFN
jgi:hypothetical protein